MIPPVVSYLEALASLPEAALEEAVALVVEGYRTSLEDADATEGSLDGSLRAVPVVALSPAVGRVVGLAAAETFVRGDGSHVGPAVVVYVPCSGSSYVVPMASVRPAEAEEAERIITEMRMAAKVRAAGPTAKAAGRSERSREGDARVSVLLGIASSMGLTVDQAGGFHKVTGPAAGRAVYLAVRGNRIDLSGFSVEHPAISQVSEQQARERRLGRVRGQVLDFSLDYGGAWAAALEGLGAG